MLEVYWRTRDMSDRNMVFIDDIIGYVTQEWLYKNGSKYTYNVKTGRYERL
jgi:hypothetical protein